MDGIESGQLAGNAHRFDRAAEQLSAALATVEALAFDGDLEVWQGVLQDLAGAHDAVGVLNERVGQLRAQLAADGRDNSGRLVDPVEARRRAAERRGWKPSRHADSDAEYFRGERDWPGDRLMLKRFNVNGDVEHAHIVLKVKYETNSGRIYQLVRQPGRRDRRETDTSMVTADELLADRWEVD